MGNMENWAWLAGLFEGEGTFFYRPPKVYENGNRSGHTLCLAIAMRDEDVIRACYDLTKVGGVSVSRQNTSPIFHWRVSKWNDIASVSEKIWPWLGERRRIQIETAVDRWNSHYTTTSIFRGPVRPIIDKSFMDRS